MQIIQYKIVAQRTDIFAITPSLHSRIYYLSIIIRYDAELSSIKKVYSRFTRKRNLRWPLYPYYVLTASSSKASGTLYAPCPLS